jgi:hypothetical protein
MVPLPGTMNLHQRTGDPSLSWPSHAGRESQAALADGAAAEAELQVIAAQKLKDTDWFAWGKLGGKPEVARAGQKLRVAGLERRRTELTAYEGKTDLRVLEQQESLLRRLEYLLERHGNSLQADAKTTVA